MESKTVVVVGVGDVVNRDLTTEGAVEPSKLMYRAILEAVDDTGLPKTTKQLLITQIDSLSVVRTWTWPYPNLPQTIVDMLGVMPTHLEYSPHGGNQPGRLFDESARRVSLGQSKVAVVTGGEALASMNAFVKAKQLPPPKWTKPSTGVDSVFSPTSRKLEQGTSMNELVGKIWADQEQKGIGANHSIGAPIQVYPLYENSFRAHRGQSLSDNLDESAELYGSFAKVAAGNPYAWFYGQPAETAESIKTITNRNRMICYPYPLLQNAFNTINLAGASILTTVEYARELGISEEKWIYPLGGAGTRDSYDFWERPNFYSSPCISRSIDAALDVSGLTKDDIDIYDFYSCFPCVPKIAAAHLGLNPHSPEKPITLLGGLTSFGGAGNNYSCHAITAMVRKLRKGKARNGLVLANGGVATYQSVVILSNRPRKDGKAYPEKNPLPEVITDVPVPAVEAEAEGEAIVETYTVQFGRDGKPELGFVIGRLKANGKRFVSNHGDESTLKQLASTSKEPIGRAGFVKKDKKNAGRNLFTFDEARL